MSVAGYGQSMETSGRTPLEVGFSDLSIGSYSVGLPPSRTGEQVVEAYLDLIALVRSDYPEDLREEDFEVLADETKLDGPFIRNRVKTHLATLSLSA